MAWRWRGRCAKGGQGHGPGVTPWHALPLLSRLCRAVVVRGVEKRNSRADLRGPAAAAVSGGRETRGRGRRAADTRGPAAAAASEGGERAGVAGPQARPRALGGAAAMVLAGLASLGQAAGCEAHFFFSFFYFQFSSLCLNSNLVLVFEFKNWCTKFIRVLDMWPTTFLYIYMEFI